MGFYPCIIVHRGKSGGALLLSMKARFLIGNTHARHTFGEFQAFTVEERNNAGGFESAHILTTYWPACTAPAWILSPRWSFDGVQAALCGLPLPPQMAVSRAHRVTRRWFFEPPTHELIDMDARFVLPCIDSVTMIMAKAHDAFCSEPPTAGGAPLAVPVDRPWARAKCKMFCKKGCADSCSRVFFESVDSAVALCRAHTQMATV